TQAGVQRGDGADAADRRADAPALVRPAESEPVRGIVPRRRAGDRSAPRGDDLAGDQPVCLVRRVLDRVVSGGGVRDPGRAVPAGAAAFPGRESGRGGGSASERPGGPRDAGLTRGYGGSFGIASWVSAFASSGGPEPGEPGENLADARVAQTVQDYLGFLPGCAGIVRMARGVQGVAEMGQHLGQIGAVAELAKEPGAVLIASDRLVMPSEAVIGVAE